MISIYHKKYLKYKTKYLNLYGGSNSFKITSADIKNNEMIDDKFTAYGDNIEPSFNWINVPQNTKLIVFMCYDPDAKHVSGKIYIHKLSTIDPFGNAKFNAVQRIIPYRGPHPPKGDGIHHYHFKVFALSKKVPIENSDYEDIINNMKNYVIGESEIVGLYEKK